jgi:hypothetical protein
MPEVADELNEYLRGDSALSRQYQREAVPLPPQSLDRRVFDAASLGQLKPMPGKPPNLAPVAFAASVFLSVALLAAILFGPQAARRTDDKAHLIEVRVFETEPPRPVLAPRERNPAAWIEDIARLRRAGRDGEADVEMRRFRSTYPNYIIPLNE